MEDFVQSTRRWYRQGLPERRRRIVRLPNSLFISISRFVLETVLLFYNSKKTIQILAMGAGKTAAEAIDEYIKNK